MNYENLNPEQKAAFDELRNLFEKLTKLTGKMSATLYPETLIGFTNHAAHAELTLEKIMTLLLENKAISEINEVTFNQ